MLDFPLWRIEALAASFIPVVLIALMLLRVGRERFSPRLLAVAVASGAMITFLPLAASLLMPLLTRLGDPLAISLTRAFAFAGLSEEGAKLIACWFIVRTHFERRSRTDFILACGGVALGFALFENIAYVSQAPEEWKAIAFNRAVSAVPMHAFIGLGMGLRLANAERQAPRNTLLVLRAWLIAAMLHACYDLPLFLAQMMPLAPTKVVLLADFLSVSIPTLFAGVFLGAVVSSSRDALAATAVGRDDLAGGDASAGSTGGGRFARVLFSPRTGLVVGGLLFAASIFGLVIGGLAMLAGAIPSATLNVASAAVFVGAMGWIFATDGFSNAKSVAREWAGAVAGFFAHKPILSGAAGLAAAAALVGVLYGIRVGTQASVAALLVVSGSTLASFGQLDQAMSKYGAALAYKPDFLPALGARAAGYRVTQNYDRALAELDRAVALYPDDPAVHGARAEIFVELHDSVKAIAEFDKAIALDGSNALLYAGRGGVRIETSDLDGALDDANRALSRRPGLSAAHVLRANVYRERDDLRQALVELDAAVKADEKNIGAYFGRALARFETRDYAGATQDFRRVLQAPEKRAYAALWLFVSGTRAGNDPRREVATWAGTLPRSVWPFPLIEFYLGVKNVEGVTAAATNADQRCELDFYRGELLFLRKNFKTAADALRTAAAECPKGYIETRAARTELKLVEAQMPMGEPALTPPSVLPSAAGSPQTVRTLSPPAAEQSKIAAPGSDAPVTASWSFRRQEGAPPKGGALTIVTPSGVDASTITFTLLRATEEQTGAEYLLKATVRQPAKTTAVGGSRINFQIPRGDEKAVMDLSVPMAMPGYYQSSLSQGEFENALNALSSARRVIVALVSSNKAAAPRSFAIDVDAFAKAALASAAPFLSDAPEAPLPSPPLAIQTMGGTGRRLALPPALSR